MSTSEDLTALKASILDLYRKGIITHTVDPNALDTITQTASGAEGVGGTGEYYVSGMVQDVAYFIDPAASFNSRTPVLPGDILRVAVDQFSIDRTVTETLSDVKITLSEASPVTVTAAQDAGYSILRKHTHSDLDTIIEQIDTIIENL